MPSTDIGARMPTPQAMAQGIDRTLGGDAAELLGSLRRMLRDAIARNNGRGIQRRYPAQRSTPLIDARMPEASLQVDGHLLDLAGELVVPGIVVLGDRREGVLADVCRLCRERIQRAHRLLDAALTHLF